MVKKIAKLLSFFKDDYRKHLIKSKISYLVNYFAIIFISYFNRNKKLVAISLIEHIGDIIANEPISREIRKRHPASTIIWFVRKPFIELIKYNPNIDKVLSVYCLTTWIKIQEKIKFEAIYDLHFNGRSCNTCYRPLRKSNVDDSINGTNYFNYGGLLRAVCLHNNIAVSDATPQMYIPLSVINKSKSLIPSESYIVIHCSSNEQIKDWAGDKWDQLVKIIIDKYKTYVLEIGTNNKISITSEKYHNLCGETSILQSAVLINKAKFFIGVDSGPAHIANAVDTPGIILLGEYYFGMKNYNPFSGNYGSLKKCRLVNSNSSVKNISVENVMENFISLQQEIASTL